jgi:hypothetical protein
MRKIHINEPPTTSTTATYNSDDAAKNYSNGEDSNDEADDERLSRDVSDILAERK